MRTLYVHTTIDYTQILIVIDDTSKMTNLYLLYLLLLKIIKH